MADSRQHTVDTQPGTPGLEERLLPVVSRRKSHGKTTSLDEQDDDYGSKQTNPEEQASWWAKWTYSYASSLIKLGYTQPLHQDDLWDMASNNETPLLTDRFQAVLHSTKCAKVPNVSQIVVMAIQYLLHLTLL